MSTAAQKEAALDHTPLTKGKYKDKTPEDVAETDPSYIVWLYETVKTWPTCSKVLYRACKDELATSDPDDLEEDQMMGDALAHAQYGSWGQG